MWNTFLSGAVEAATGKIVSSGVSSITSRQEMLDRLEETLFCLNHKVLEIKSIIQMARRRQIIDQEMLEWLQAIIQAQLLGDYYVRAFNSNPNTLSTITQSGCENSLSITPYTHLAKHIKTLLFGDSMLSELYAVQRKLNSINLDFFIQLVMGQPEICRPIKEYLYMDQTRLFGRDRERVQVTNFLFETNLDGEGTVDILSIVGSPGVGKAALVRHCFLDPKVHNHFSQKIYINGYWCISFSDILDQCKGWNNVNPDDEETQLEMLKQSLCSERILLVIENCDNSIELEAWNTLWDCLRCAKKGSKIILTFHNECRYNYFKTCINFGSVSKLNIDVFSKEDYLLFFYEHAFGTVNPNDHPKLASMGEKIARKMNGSIWGAKIIGEVLRDNMVPQFWSKLLRVLSSNYPRRVRVLLDPWLAVDTIVRLKGLRLSRLSIGPENLCCPAEKKVASFRDLMVIGSDLFRPLVKGGKNLGVNFVVAKNIFLSECTVIIAACDIETISTGQPRATMLN